MLGNFKVNHHFCIVFPWFSLSKQPWLSHSDRQERDLRLVVFVLLHPKTADPEAKRVKQTSRKVEYNTMIVFFGANQVNHIVSLYPTMNGYALFYSLIAMSNNYIVG